MEEIATWFKREVLRWRSGASVAWLIIVSPPSIFCAVMLANIDIFHPAKWLSGCLYNLLSFWQWFHSLHIAIIIAVVAIISARHYKVISDACCRSICRLEVISAPLQPGRLLHITLTSLLCGLSSWLYTALICPRFHSLTVPCQENGNGRCLNEPHAFFVLHGAFTGLLYAVGFHVCHENVLSFPVIQQSKYFRVKMGMMSLLCKTPKETLKRIKYFYLFYYLMIGQIMKRLVFENLSILPKPGETAIDTLYGVMDLQLFWQTVVFGMLLYFILSTAALLYTVYHTDPFQFPIHTMVDMYKNKCLHNALACKTNMNVQYLGYQDLSLTSRHDVGRRQEIFSLTTLGGHPHNWNLISKQCLEAINEFTDRVAGFNAQVMANGPVRQLNEDPRLSQPTAIKKSTSGKIVEHMKRMPIFAFFLADLPDSKSRSLFADAQRYIWAVDSVTHLVSASYTEDKYGVVQKSLPEILTAVLRLYEVLEKHFKVATNISRKSSDGGSTDAPDQCLRYALRATLKSGIYRIASTFHQQIKSISMGVELQKKLAHFLEYKE